MLKIEYRNRAVEEWEERIRGDNLSGRWMREALSGNLAAWIDRSHGSLPFRITQVT